MQKFRGSRALGRKDVGITCPKQFFNVVYYTSCTVESNARWRQTKITFWFAKKNSAWEEKAWHYKGSKMSPNANNLKLRSDGCKSKWNFGFQKGISAWDIEVTEWQWAWCYEGSKTPPNTNKLRSDRPIDQIRVTCPYYVQQCPATTWFISHCMIYEKKECIINTSYNKMKRLSTGNIHCILFVIWASLSERDVRKGADETRNLCE